ncbi:retrovirus-related pol polyprotein from transposon TNT 1-94 [Tanacetum coccineum]
MPFMSTVMTSRFLQPTTNSEHLPIQETKLPFKMTGLLFNKFKRDRVRVLLVHKLKEMLQAIGEIMLQVKQGLLSVTIAQESGQELDEEQLAFLADPGVADDAYDSDCDDISSAKVVLMANLSSYDLDVLSEMSEQMSNHVTNWDKVNQETKTVNESLTAELERYKERVKTFEQRLNVDLNSREKFIDSQMDDMIRNRNALKQEIDSLKQTLSKQVKEKESLLQTFTVFKKESKEKENKYMDKEIDLEKKIKELDNIVYKVGQSAQTVHMLTKPQVFYDDTHKQALGYQNPFYLKKAQRIKPTLYDGIVISKKHDVISVVDEEETLILEEESRSKMLAKQNDPISKEKKINISPINYSELNKLSEDFGKRFVPQMQLSAEQAFWLPLSNPKSEQLVVTQTPVEIEVPKELPKISLVNTSLQKLKNHLARFDKVVKVRTTPNAIIEGSCGFEHTKQVFKEEVIPFINSLRASFKDFENGLHSEINEVKTVFNQMKAAVEQCAVDKKYFNIQKKELSLDNDRLLDHIICQEVMNIMMHANFVHINVLPTNNKSLVNDNFEIEQLEQENDHLFELLLSEDIVHICVNSLATCNICHEIQQSFVNEYNENLVLKAELAKKEHMVEKKLTKLSFNNQNALEIPEFFKINEWQAKLDAKDVSIANLRKHIESLKGKNVVENMSNQIMPRTNNGTKFVKQTLRAYYEDVGISHQTSVARSLQQNGVVERRNRTLVEAARTMLIFSNAPLFLWAEALRQLAIHKTNP